MQYLTIPMNLNQNNCFTIPQIGMPTIREVWNHGTYIDDWACFHEGDCAKEWLVEYQGVEYVVITDFDDTVLNDPESIAPVFQTDDEEE